jgi:hypothetical protein
VFPYTRIHNSISLPSVGAILIHRVLHGRPDHDAHVVYRLYQPASHFPPFPTADFLQFSFSIKIHVRCTGGEHSNAIHYTIRYCTQASGIGTGESVKHGFSFRKVLYTCKFLAWRKIGFTPTTKRNSSLERRY